MRLSGDNQHTVLLGFYLRGFFIQSSLIIALEFVIAVISVNHKMSLFFDTQRLQYISQHNLGKASKLCEASSTHP